MLAIFEAALNHCQAGGINDWVRSNLKGEAMVRSGNARESDR